MFLKGGFAPVVIDGFGLGYRILDNTLGACVTSYSQNDLKSYVDVLVETYDMFYDILKNSSAKN
jgi:hypothetical protein